MDATEYEAIRGYLQTNIIPPEIKSDRYRKKNFVRKCKGIYFQENKLMKIFRKKNGYMKYLEIPLVSEIDNIIGFYHNVTHPGINTTIDGIRNKYDWNGIYNDVGSYIRTCHDCQTSAALPPQPQRELQPIPPPEEPWCHCGIDLICNMSRTVLGFQHILVIVCYLSKFVIVRPLKTKTSKEILDCLQEIYLSFGVPNILQHDQGTEFSSKEFQEFHKKINVNTRRTTAYHPQSDGLVESHNKILKTKINKMQSEGDTEWTEKLQTAVLAANTQTKISTSYTPFYLMFGRDFDSSNLLNLITSPTNPGLLTEADISEAEVSEDENIQMDANEPHPFDFPIIDNEWIENLSSTRKADRMTAIENIKAGQKVQKKTYDSKVKHNRSEFVEGDEVLVHNIKKAKRLPGTKDAKKYLGAYTIEEVKPSHLVARKDPDSKTTKLPIHLSRKYHSRMNEIRQVRTKTGKSKKPKRSCKFPSSDSLDDILNLDTMEETFVTPQQHSIYENINSELLQLKPRILSALVNNTYLTQLHEKLATKAASLTSLNLLYSYHPPNELNFEIKEKLAVSAGNWYAEYRSSYPTEIPEETRRDLDYPIAVLLPVIIELIFPTEQVHEIIEIPEQSIQNASDLIPYPKWGGEYNNIVQSNTCSIDNILAILSSNKATILDSLKLIGSTHIEANFHYIFQLAANCEFEKLREYVATKIGLEVIYDSSGLIRSYDFFGSEGNIIK
ncbi:hypothetical protein LOD99_1838 [Oopsacas minuta]|uniref:Integrase catalytic domain-containing protein n=1 Tax=Oopsacas minuta TaxID=111878 RepID=A0AAV7K3D0_9METZ|nr:hypothetical protein LOD99_1838 [Oopsacas minuta]